MQVRHKTGTTLCGGKRQSVNDWNNKTREDNKQTSRDKQHVGTLRVLKGSVCVFMCLCVCVCFYVCVNVNSLEITFSSPSYANPLLFLPSLIEVVFWVMEGDGREIFFWGGAQGLMRGLQEKGEREKKTKGWLKQGIGRKNWPFFLSVKQLNGKELRLGRGKYFTRPGRFANKWLNCCRLEHII